MTIESFCQDPDFGDLYAINGIDPMIRWDGYAASFENAGMIAPTVKPTLAGSGTGSIVGTYYAYLRFKDALGNYSDLSPISTEFEALGATKTITNATATTPIVITSAAHGLVTGNWVKVTGVGGVDSANATWQVTVITANTFSLDDSVSDGVISYTGGGSFTSGIGTINYTNVQVPTESKVVGRQILRNTDGQAITFYVDVDTSDITATSFSSSLSDSLLSAGESQAILDDDNLPLANGNAPPPNVYKCLAQQLDRLFACGILEYNIGSASVTFGSASVIGAGTEWKTTFAGRFLYIDGASKSYEIESVNETTQVITLTETYTDPTDLFGFYAIKPPSAYRRLLAFSQPGKAQSWPAFNALPIQDTGDDITGEFQMGPYLYVTEKTHIHRFLFDAAPLFDGGIFMSAFRGAVNQRCVIVVDAVAYMLDELGCHRFKGNAEVEPISLPIQPLFQKSEDQKYQINWHWKEYFHASLDRQRETIRWHVSMDGNRYPKHALCHQYRTNRWWIEEYPIPIGGTCVGYMGGSSGLPQVYFGGQHGKILAAWIGTVDNVDPGEGTIQSTATASSAYSLTDSAASWPTTGIVNAQIAIVGGLGQGQSRRIVAVSDGVATIDTPWSILPDTTSIYQIGGIPWSFKSAWMRLSDSEEMANRRWQILFKPHVKGEATANLRFVADFEGNLELQAVNTDYDDGGGIKSVADESDLSLDLTKRTGMISRQLPGGKEYFIEGKEWVQYELDGYSNEDQLRIYQLIYEGVKVSG